MVIKGVIFVLFPFFIFWSLLGIVCGDPGAIDPQIIDKLLQDNNINRSDLEDRTKRQAACLTLTENYLRK